MCAGFASGVSAESLPMNYCTWGLVLSARPQAGGLPALKSFLTPVLWPRLLALFFFFFGTSGVLVLLTQA